MKVKLEQLPERYQRQARQQLADTDSSTVAKCKSNTGNESVGKKKVKGRDRQAYFTCPVRITYRESRKRLLDADNGWTKYFTDALVSGGVLQNDTPQEIPERPKHTQVKDSEEGLIIMVEEI